MVCAGHHTFFSSFLGKQLITGLNVLFYLGAVLVSLSTYFYTKKQLRMIYFKFQRSFS